MPKRCFAGGYPGFYLIQRIFLPVTPGTKFITLGGAIASDVHEKNHHLEGCFTQHVLHFELLTESGAILRCSPDEWADLFWSTAGGMSLTGMILSARFRLKPVESAYVRQESIKVKNLDAVMRLFGASQQWTYTMLMRGEHARVAELKPTQCQNPLQIKLKKRIDISFFFPGFVLNPFSVRAFNFLYYHKQRRPFKCTLTAFYPLDALRGWNKIYFPKERSEVGLHEVLSFIAQSRQDSFLAILKLFGKASLVAVNSFPKEGYTLSLYLL